MANEIKLSNVLQQAKEVKANNVECLKALCESFVNVKLVVDQYMDECNNGYAVPYVSHDDLSA
jgi:hypothetical protein